ncbi:lipase [Terriglobus roseus]|uniref:Lipase (Class 2) n=1 Tax=Terriglobus roseus TaxID=392734 RepID=A0A1G7H822_9BACT|nr:lipase [Terriglobus roseus]SDE96525.1 Lipase (class 2) [Terriglobus roseus]
MILNQRIFFVVAVMLSLASLPTFGQNIAPKAEGNYPIVFVHGNGDDAAKWVGTIWLFESNGYPKDRLYAIRFSNPVARTDDSKPEANRSSTVDAASELSSFVTRVLLETHSRKVILIGSSRGGLTIRNYIQNGGGQSNVAAAILAGTPNHGVLVSTANLNGEFNGGGHFLTALNHANDDGSEVVDGVRFLTLRSDKLDKYAQPTGGASGASQVSTGVTFEGPALRGATNVVLPNLDHRELAFAPAAFREMFRFVTGTEPKTLIVQHEQTIQISGTVTGFTGVAPTNLPMQGVHLNIYPVSKDGGDSAPSYSITTGADGQWGPFTASSTQEYCFDLEFQGRHVRYFKAPLLRSTALLNLRFLPAPRDTTTHTANTALLFIARPEGYFSAGRDPVTLNGKSVSEEPQGLPVRDSFLLGLPDIQAVSVTLRGEHIIAQPSKDIANDLPIVDFLW